MSKLSKQALDGESDPLSEETTLTSEGPSMVAAYRLVQGLTRVIDVDLKHTNPEPTCWSFSTPAAMIQDLVPRVSSDASSIT